jgi:hypothetical protein
VLDHGPEPFLRLAQLLLGLPALGDVEDDPLGHPRDAVLVPDDHALIVDPHPMTVAMAEPILRLVRDTLGVQPLRRGHHRVVVVRVEALFPEPRLGLPFLRRVAVDLLDLRTHVDGL